MPAPVSVAEFADLVRKSNLIEPGKLDSYLSSHGNANDSPTEFARKMTAAGMLTRFQADQLLKGKHRGFILGHYKLLEKLGMGGMGQVFLAEHTSMKRRAAIKVLPPELASNEFARERFLREARAAGLLDHPNLVRAFDVDVDGEVVYLVMEYIDGISMHDLVVKSGPLDPARAGYYLWQIAAGLAYVHSAGLIHRDIKPANLLVDRTGTVKILDLGLVRSQFEDNELTRGQGVKILGTADFLAPEQAINCSAVDIRADIYSLGATGYFLLTGRLPYPGEKVAQKLIAHQVMPVPKVIDARPDIPADLSEAIERMMAKKPADRFQTPAEVAVALEKWAMTPPPPPSDLALPGQPNSGTSGGSVVGLGIRTPYPGGPSFAGPMSGSAIRYYGDSAIRPGLSGASSSAKMQPLAPLTPIPSSSDLGPAAQIKPAGVTRGGTAVAEAPPALPAARTHLLTTEPLPDSPLPAVFNPFRVTHTAAEPAPADSASPPRRRGGRRLTVAVAVIVALAVAAWDVALISGALSRSNAAQPDEQSANSVNVTTPPAEPPAEGNTSG